MVDCDLQVPPYALVICEKGFVRDRGFWYASLMLKRLKRAASKFRDAKPMKMTKADSESYTQKGLRRRLHAGTESKKRWRVDKTRGLSYGARLLAVLLSRSDFVSRSAAAAGAAAANLLSRSGFPSRSRARLSVVDAAADAEAAGLRERLFVEVVVDDELVSVLPEDDLSRSEAFSFSRAVVLSPELKLDDFKKKSKRAAKQKAD